MNDHKTPPRRPSLALLAATFLLPACAGGAKTVAVHLCRETPATTVAILDDLSKEGWRFGGVLHHDGLNCTVTLWSCEGAAGCAMPKEGALQGFLSAP